MIEKFVKLINYLKSVPGVSDVDFSIKDPMTIEFKHTSQEFINNFCCLFDDRDIFNEGDISYTKNENHIFVKFNKHKSLLVDKIDACLYVAIAQSFPKHDKSLEYGVSDLSLTTINQMISELKKRENLLFALIWIENNETDNISIEGNGTITNLSGLITRGLHLLINYGDE